LPQISGAAVRRIHVEDGLVLRFPGRSEDFAEGVEIGILALLLSSGARGFTHRISTRTVEQARDLAVRMGYRLTEGPSDGLMTEIILRTGRARPALTLVHSSTEPGQNVA
jgi:hypothetical protein